MDGVFHVRAESTVNVLHGVTDPMPRACRPPFRRQGFRACRNAVIERPHRTQVDRAQCLEVDITVGQAVLDGLEAADGSAELPALAHIGGGATQRLLQHAELLGGVCHLRPLERPADDPAGDIPQHLRRSGLHLRQRQPRLRLPAGADLRLDAQARAARLDEKHAYAVFAPGRHQQQLRLSAVGYADLLPAQPPAALERRGLCRRLRGVSARGLLECCSQQHFPGHQRGQQCLLRGAAELL